MHMLQVQRKLRKDTISLHLRLPKDRARKPARADLDKARQLAEGETGLALEADKVYELLREEGSTIVIPDVVEDMKGDLDSLAVRLNRVDAGTYTQQIQLDIIQTLRELIEVIQDERDRKQGKAGKGGEPQEGDSPDSLLPTSAELKMLKALQVRVNKRTSLFDRMREKDDSERGRIAGKQSGCADLTRTMADKLNQEED